jgi:neutral amino acid transport system ATP-binding protein
MLEVRGCRLAFGGVKAVDDVSIAVAEGSITGLIGTNGAGKTTLFNIVSGFLKPDAGCIRFRDADITADEPSSIAGGASSAPSRRRSLPADDGEENMLCSRRTTDAPALALSGTHVPRETLEAADAISPISASSRGAILGAGPQRAGLKMLEFARAMMARPTLLMLDEPAAGVNPALIESLSARIESLRRQGVSFLLVDHNLTFVCSVCDVIYAMADGRIIAEGSPNEVIRDPKVLELYIGKGVRSREDDHKKGDSKQ